MLKKYKNNRENLFICVPKRIIIKAVQHKVYLSILHAIYQMHLTYKLCAVLFKIGKHVAVHDCSNMYFQKEYRQKSLLGNAPETRVHWRYLYHG